jgi:branched-chain amino acid transport system permease protein
MNEFVQQVIDGLGSGTVYAGLALALAVVYVGTGFMNFAQGEQATVAAFVAWTLVSHGVGPWPALVAGAAGSAVLGALIERLLVRPVEGAAPLTQLTVTVALLLGLNGLTAIIWGADQHVMASPFGSGVLPIGGITLTADQIGSTAVVAAVVIALGGFFRFTDLGLTMRAVALDPDSAALLGIRVGRMRTAGWALAAAVGAVAGVMAASTLGVSSQMMQGPLLLAFAAATLGGFGSRAGAVVGSLLIGVMTALAGRYVPGLGGDLALAVPFAVIAVVLLARPSGLSTLSRAGPR